jgi:hypothetical protein
MGKFVYFTSTEKRQANEVDLPSFLRDRGEKLLKAGREYRLASDHSITVRANRWYDHAVRRGGHAISFVRQFYDKTFPEAVSMLLGRDGHHSHRKAGAGAAGAKTLCPAEALPDYAQDVCLSHQTQVHRPGCGHGVRAGEAAL